MYKDYTRRQAKRRDTSSGDCKMIIAIADNKLTHWFQQLSPSWLSSWSERQLR